MPLNEKQGFVPDTGNPQTPDDKNDILIQALEGAYHGRNIVLIERIEIGSTSGWRITYRS